jgi:uncharacterized protein
MSLGLIHLATWPLGLVLLAGCGSSPEVIYYTLSAPGLDGTAPAEAEQGYSIAIGPVSLPDVVDRPQLVVRRGANEVTLSEGHQWAEPLASEIPRIIAEHLTRVLGTQQVSASPQNSVRPDYRVMVDIQRFDSELQGSTEIDAIWTIHHISPKGAPNRSGRSRAREATGGGGYEAIVAAHSRALAAVSRDIAEAIRSEQSTPR